MDQVQISEKFQSERLLFIYIGYHEKVSFGNTFTFCITQPVAKEVNIITFTEPAPRLIQSSSLNVHYKDEGLKQLCIEIILRNFGH